MNERVNAAQESNVKEPDPLNGFNRIKIAGFLVLISTLIIVSHIPGVRDHFTIEAITSQIEVISAWANRAYGIPLFIMVSAALLLVHLPEMPIIIIAGLLYDFTEAFLYTWIGCTLGTTGVFLISRFLLRDYFQPRLKKSFLRKFNKRLEKDGIFTMCFLRFFLFLFPPLNWLIGATGIRTRDYIIGNAIGIVPWLLGILFTIKKVKSVKSLADLFVLETFSVVIIFIVVFLAIYFIRNKLFLVSEPSCNAEQGGREIIRGRTDVQER